MATIATTYVSTADDAWAASLDGHADTTGHVDAPGGWTAMVEPVADEFWILTVDYAGNRTATPTPYEWAVEIFDAADDAYVDADDADEGYQEWRLTWEV